MRCKFALPFVLGWKKRVRCRADKYYFSWQQTCITDSNILAICGGLANRYCVCNTRDPLLQLSGCERATCNSSDVTSTTPTPRLCCSEIRFGCMQVLIDISQGNRHWGINFVAQLAVYSQIIMAPVEFWPRVEQSSSQHPLYTTALFEHSQSFKLDFSGTR